MDCRINYDTLTDFVNTHKPTRYQPEMLALAFTPDGMTVNGTHVPGTDTNMFRSYTCTTSCAYTIEYCLLDFYQDLDGLEFHLTYDADTHAFRIAQD